MKIVVPLIAVALMGVGCSSSAPEGGSAADQAAAKSNLNAPEKPVSAQTPPPTNPDTGTGSEGIRSVAPSTPGDRN